MPKKEPIIQSIFLFKINSLEFFKKNNKKETFETFREPDRITLISETNR